MKFRKMAGIGMSALLAAALAAGCGSSTGSSGSGKGTGAEGSTQEGSAQAGSTGESVKSDGKPDDLVTLKWYMSINPVYPDTDKVIARLNEYLKDKIGVKIDYTVIANPDYKEKMPTLINSGDDFDICFTADWTTNYLQFVAKDAFLDITDLLPQYAKDTYDFIPQALWHAVSVNDKIYGVPSYKEMGGQNGLFVNTDMAKEYGIDLSTVKTLEDYTKVLETVKEKSTAAGKKVIGVSGMTYSSSVPYESLTNNPRLPGASPVKDYGNFQGQPEVFNQYDTPDYMNYCKLVHDWFTKGYLSDDPVNYDLDTAKRDNDFKNGDLFSYEITYAPGAEDAEAAKDGHGVTYIPLMKPLFETRNAMGGLLAISAASRHPDKALEFINLLNTDQYVGTLIRHGIEGVNYVNVGDDQIDRTMGGTLAPADNGYDYTYGWQFGTPFNQKWDISYPKNIEDMFMEYNKSAIVAPHNGFTFDSSPVESEIAALTSTEQEYGPALEKGMVDPETNIPKFLQALKDNGTDVLLQNIRDQLAAAK